MSFLLDPLFLIVIGVAIVYLAEKFLRKTLRNPILVLSVVTVALFWSISGLLYLDYLDFPLLGKAGSGRHFMWNSGVELIGLNPPIDVSVTYANPFTTLNIVAVMLFATYPLFLYLGVYVGSKIFSKSRMRKI
ncbi:MAG: hypothetical protein OEY81_07320 [Candidatus Bathyarchaeota archaeon]|nr:hypothetical protein [Candidatus Bathyarchaeota archaeon]